MFQTSSVSSSFSNSIGDNMEIAIPHNFVSSGVVAETLCFTWEVKNFDVLRRSANMIKAQYFEFSAGETVGLRSKWSFSLKPTEDNWIGCFFKLLKCPGRVNEVNVSFIVKINYPNGENYFNGEQVPIKNMMGEDMKEEPHWGCAKVINQSSVLPLQPNGSLTIEVEFKLYNCQKSISEKTEQDKLVIYQQKFLEQLSLDLHHSHDLGLPAVDDDTTLVSKDGFPFYVNRGILAARSPVFLQIFQNQMLKIATQSIHFPDLSAKTINVLLDYLVSAKLHKNWKDEDVIEELLLSAHKFELPLLAEFLNVILVDVCTMGNAKKLALRARQMGLTKAEADLFHFIKRNATSLEDLTMVWI